MKKSSGVIGSIDLYKGPVNIYGGGICGLLFAHYLKKNSIDFVLHEKSSRLGGKISSTQTEYGLVESAANAIYSSEDLLELLDDLKLKPLRATTNLKRYIFRKGKERSFP